MPEKRTTILKGKPVTLLGPELKVGQIAPDFSLVPPHDRVELSLTIKNVSLSQSSGKVRLISVVPSLDTPVCDMETRRFNQEAETLGADTRILTVSMDLPFAQKRWCGAAGVSHVITLSDHRDAAFGTAFGVLINELRLLARSIFVLDRNGVIQYIQHVKELSEEPNYDAVIEAVQRIV